LAHPVGCFVDLFRTNHLFPAKPERPSRAAKTGSSWGEAWNLDAKVIRIGGGAARNNSGRPRKNLTATLARPLFD
jgi:hypothetical protein